MVVDASAIVAVLNRESDAEIIAGTINARRGRLKISPLAVFEATLALARAGSAKSGRSPSRADMKLAQDVVDAFIRANDISEIDITPAIGRIAIEAAAVYGKAVGHPADLNFGDCFAYACAKAHGASLLFKGEDFARTDIARYTSTC